MNDIILILNYSDEFSVEAAKRLRAEHIFCRIISGMTTAGQIRDIAPRGVIMAGEAMSGTGVFDAEILQLGIPLLAMGHAAHMLLAAQGGASAGAAVSQRTAMIEYGTSALFYGLKNGERYLPEALTLMLPPDVRMTASAAGCTIGFEDTERRRYGVQFELERNDPDGTAILTNFARHICGCNAWWTTDAAIHESMLLLEAAAERGGQAVCAVSGGVDSTVAAVLAHKAFGERMHAVFVDTGLLREGEADQVCAIFEEMGVPLVRADLSDEVLCALRGKTREAEKNDVLMRCLHEEIAKQAQQLGADTLVLGSNYTDYLHGGADQREWADSKMVVVEPLRAYFKREICDVAAQLGFGRELIERKPFPTLGLGARIVGEVTRERLEAMRITEAIFREEICEVGLERKLHKYFPVLAGQMESGGETVVLRAVTQSSNTLLPARLPYDLIERTVERIMKLAPQVHRVFYDQTPTQVGKELFF